MKIRAIGHFVSSMVTVGLVLAACSALSLNSLAWLPGKGKKRSSNPDEGKSTVLIDEVPTSMSYCEETYASFNGAQVEYQCKLYVDYFEKLESDPKWALGAMREISDEFRASYATVPWGREFLARYDKVKTETERAELDKEIFKSDLHRENPDKVIFSSTSLRGMNPDRSGISDHFGIMDIKEARVYFDGSPELFAKSLNLDKPRMVEEWRFGDRVVFTRFGSANEFDMKRYEGEYTLRLGNGKTPAEGGTVRRMAMVLDKDKPGKGKVFTVTVWMANDKGEKLGDPISSGSVTLDISAADRAKFIKLHGGQILGKKNAAATKACKTWFAGARVGQGKVLVCKQVTKWEVVRNSLGVIVEKVATADLGWKDNEGRCFHTGLKMFKKHQGGNKYGPISSNIRFEEEAACGNMK